MDRKKTIQNFFILGLFILMFVLVLGIFVPFFTILLWSALLYILGSPLYTYVMARQKKEKRLYELKRHLLSGLFAVGTLFVIILPLTGIVLLLIQQLTSFLQSTEHFFSENPNFFSTNPFGKYVSDALQKLSLGRVDVENINIEMQLTLLIRQYSSTIFSVSTRILSNVGQFMLSLVFMVFSLYFFYLDGPYLLSLLGKAFPIDPDQMRALVAKFTEITRHLFSGYFLVSLYQGIASFILMSVFGIKGALLFSVVLLFCSFIPMFGAATVWLPVGIVLILTDSMWKGLLFLVLSGFFISLLDNILRPFFLQDRIKIHPLIIFFAILGGVQLFGFNGLLLGPITIILFFTILDMITLSGTEIPPIE